MSLARWIQYRVNFWFDLLLRVIEAGTFFLFWQIILSNQPALAGWNFQGFLLIYFFESIFIWFYICFTQAASQIWTEIVQGSLDKFLSRPTVPWAMLVLENMYPQIAAFLVSGAALFLVIASGVPISIPILFIGLVMALLGGIIAFLFGLSLATLSFWFGRISELDRFFESFWEFEWTPTTLFPTWIQTIVAFTFPFIFIHTIPTLALLQRISFQQFAQYFLYELVVIAIWCIAFNALWSAGVKRYESYGG